MSASPAAFSETAVRDLLVSTPESGATISEGMTEVRAQARGRTLAVRFPAPLPRWARSVVERLLMLHDLDKNWDAEGALEVSRTSIEHALEALVFLGGDIPPPFIAPTVEGGVQLEWHGRDLWLEIEFTPTGSALLAVEVPNDSIDWEGQLGRLSELDEALREAIRRRLRALA